MSFTMTTATVTSFTSFTNLGPLRTPTSFPDDCLSSLFDFNTNGLGLQWTYGTQGCALSTCCPSGNFYTEGLQWMTSYYSPGVCPSSYKTCAPPPSPTALSSSAGETIAFCCPQDYYCPNTTPGSQYIACFSLLSTSTSIIVLDNIFDQSTISTSPYTIPSTLANEYQIAYPIQVRWKAGDFDSGASTSTNAAKTGSSATDTTHTSHARTSSLGTGAIVGIAIGGFLLLLSVIVAAFFIIRTKRKRRNPTSDNGNVDPSSKHSNSDAGLYYFKPELDSQVMSLQADTRGELTPETCQQIYQAQSQNSQHPVELQGDLGGHELR